MEQYRYAITLSKEMHDKMKLGIAQKKIDARVLQGYMRFFIRKTLEYSGVIFTKDVDKGWKLGLTFNSSNIPQPLIEMFLMKEDHVEKDNSAPLPALKPIRSEESIGDSIG